jgi:hypothetical protein
MLRKKQKSQKKKSNMNRRHHNTTTIGPSRIDGSHPSPLSSYPLLLFSETQSPLKLKQKVKLEISQLGILKFEINKIYSKFVFFSFKKFEFILILVFVYRFNFYVAYLIQFQCCLSNYST